MTKFTKFAETNTSKKLADLTNEEIYAIVKLRKKGCNYKPKIQENVGFTISLSSLSGKLLSNNLINLGVYKGTFKTELEALVSHWLKLKTLNQNHH